MLDLKKKLNKSSKLKNVKFEKKFNKSIKLKNDIGQINCNFR